MNHLIKSIILLLAVVCLPGKLAQVIKHETPSAIVNAGPTGVVGVAAASKTMRSTILFADVGLLTVMLIIFGTTDRKHTLRIDSPKI